MDHSELIATLTLEQKCALLSGAETFKTRGYPKLGVPKMWLSDGPHGLRKQAGEADHLGINPSVPATCFPTAATAAASWDPELGYELGVALGEECLAQNVSVLLGPGLNIKRSPLCGRNFEYFSEDPLLAGEMAASYVRGIQSQGVSACPKHFAVNSQETRRMSSDSVLDERTLREIYLSGFETVVKKGSPYTIMTSYNMVNGEYANESKHLIQEVLRGEWGFDGVVVTDWGGQNDRVLATKVGATLEMPAPGAEAPIELTKAVQDGRLSEADIDARLEEMLTLADRTAAARAENPDFDAAAHHALARMIAGRCAVLLKNEDAVLPLATGEDAPSVAVLGAFASEPRFQGAGSSAVNATHVDSFVDMVSASDLNYVGFEPAFPRGGGSDAEMAAKAVELAGKADVVLLCLGLTEAQESEGVDRNHMKLDPAQVSVLEQVAAVNSNVVVLLSCGSSLETPWLDKCRGLVLLGLGGQAGAGAALDVVTGAVNPSGHLAETWPVALEDTPSMACYPAEGRYSEYREGLYVGYRYFDTAGVPVAFPFGYGLSYTTFAYGDAQFTPAGADAGSEVLGTVAVEVVNTGSVAGAEVVQLYLEAPRQQVFGPKRELAGFARVELEPGESKVVTIELTRRAASYWNVATNGWEIEGGSYTLAVGSSVEEIRATVEVQLAGTGAPAPYEGLDLAPYETAEVLRVEDKYFEALLGRPLPSGKVPIDANMCFRELNHGRSPLLWLVWFILNKLYESARKKGETNINVAFIYNMPLRGVGRMAGSISGMGVANGLVMEAKGFWIIGIIRAICGFVANFARNISFNGRMKDITAE